MKNNFVRGSFVGVAIALVMGLLVSFTNSSTEKKASYTYMQITTIESVVPGGLGRSRMIATDASGNVVEGDMENFFSMTGINFKNVRFNDKQITSKLTEMSGQGWELQSVNSGCYSGEKATGIFVTRYLFRK